jgi:hypothetical protein
MSKDFSGLENLVKDLWFFCFLNQRKRAKCISPMKQGKAGNPPPLKTTPPNSSYLFITWISLKSFVFFCVPLLYKYIYSKYIFYFLIKKNNTLATESFCYY